MNRRTNLLRAVALSMVTAFAALLAPTPAAADEGMWLINEPPTRMLVGKYGFRPSSEFLENLQKSALRFGFGGSASFVSADGLIMTNHHVAYDQLAKLSTPERNLLVEGFHATTREEELKCPDAQVVSLQEIIDVTDRVRDAAAPEMDRAEANEARQRMIAEIESESQDESGLFSQVVELYGGGKYHLYRYERYTDIRMVFAPEGNIAHFGGDVDNFEFPRFCLDATFLRAYDDNGEPVRPAHYLRFSQSGADAGDLVMVVGHPGRTQRNFTVDHLRFLRDVDYPARMEAIRTREVELNVMASQGPEMARQAADDLSGYRNGRKGLGGKLRALQDPTIFKIKMEQEREILTALEQNTIMSNMVGSGYEDIRAALRNYAGFYDRYALLERWPFGRSDLFSKARTILRLVDERSKPSGERLREYRDSNLSVIEQQLYSAAPIYKELEANKLQSGIDMMIETLGGDHPDVLAVLSQRSPSDIVSDMIRKARLYDPNYRKRLVEGGRQLIMKDVDPVMRMAIKTDFMARKVRERYEDEVEAVLRDAYAGIANARFALYGDSIYPDATFSLRLSVGQVRGYEEGRSFVEPFTTFAGLFERADAKDGPEFDLPQSWIDARSTLDLTTPFNF
ncbi:MAG: S46 family peptidase, partial [Planctomycetota bacterium]